MSKLLIVGDLHLGKGLNLGKVKPKQLNSKILDQFHLLDWVLDQAFDKKVDRIVLTGDVFEDTKPSFVLMEGFLDFLSYAEEEKIYVDIVLGNHDLTRTGQNLFSSLDILQHIKYKYVNFYKYLSTLELDDMYLTLMPFRDRRFYNLPTMEQVQEEINLELSLETAKFHYDYLRVLVGHLALSGCIPVGDEFDDNLNEIMCPINLFDAYQYVWMGHVHKPQIVKSTDRQHIAHIGNLDLCNIDEIGQEKILIYLDSQKNLVETIKIPVRSLFKLKLQFLDKTGDLTFEVIKSILEFSIKNEVENSTFKLEIDLLPDAYFDLDQVKSFLYSLKVFHLAQVLENKIINPSNNVEKSSFEDLLEPKAAFKIWANSFEFPDGVDVSEFLHEGYQIIESYEEHDRK